MIQTDGMTKGGARRRRAKEAQLLLPWGHPSITIHARPARALEHHRPHGFCVYLAHCKRLTRYKMRCAVGLPTPAPLLMMLSC